MKLVRTLVIIGLGLLFIGIVGGLLLPSTARVVRKATINAPDDVVFAAVNTLAMWPSWAVWFRQDTTATLSYQGPPSGTGATVSWNSAHGDLGNGELVVTQATPSSSVSFTFAMDGQDPTPASIRIVDAGNGTSTVTWELEADFGFNLFARWFGLFFDSMIGPDFEQGLANLDAMLRTIRGRCSDVQSVTIPATNILYVEASTPTTSIGAALATSFARITRYASQQNLTLIGAPFVEYRSWDGYNTTLVAMLPVLQADTGSGDVKGALRPLMKAVAIDYYGPYELVGLARDRAEQHLRARNLPVTASWEEYLTDPASAPDPATWHTRVYYSTP